MGGSILVGRDRVGVLSADAALDSVQQAFQAGASDYLVTPYDPVVLEEKVERLLTEGVSLQPVGN